MIKCMLVVFLSSPLSATSIFLMFNSLLYCMRMVCSLSRNTIFFFTLLHCSIQIVCLFMRIFGSLLFFFHLKKEAPKEKWLEKKNVACSELKKNKENGDSSSDEKPSFYENGCVRASERRNGELRWYPNGLWQSHSSKNCAENQYVYILCNCIFSEYLMKHCAAHRFCTIFHLSSGSTFFCFLFSYSFFIVLQDLILHRLCSSFSHAISLTNREQWEVPFIF